MANQVAGQCAGRCPAGTFFIGAHAGAEVTKPDMDGRFRRDGKGAHCVHPQGSADPCHFRVIRAEMWKVVDTRIRHNQMTQAGGGNLPRQAGVQRQVPQSSSENIGLERGPLNGRQPLLHLNDHAIFFGGPEIEQKLSRPRSLQHPGALIL